MSKPRIIIYVEGGVVHEVVSNTDIELIILDFDTFDSIPDEKKMFEDKIQDKRADENFMLLMDKYKNIWNKYMGQAFTEP